MLSRLRPRLTRASSLIALLAVAACKKDAPAPPPVPTGARPSAPEIPAAPARPAEPAPPSQEALPTTAGNIAFGNLAGDMESAEKLLGPSPTNADLILRVVPIFLMYAKTTGAVSYFDRALSLAETATKLQPTVPRVWMMLSTVHAVLHRFDEAHADLDKAQKLGASPGEIDAPRASLLQAQGRFAEARPLMEKLATALPRIDTLGALASLDLDEGRFAEAQRHFRAAQDSYRDVSPFPIVWVLFQQGLMWEKQDQLARARDYFSAAHDRLAEDAQAASHLAAALAATGDRERAIAVLRPVLRLADDPEYMGQLSQLVREQGNAKEADELKAKASERFDALLKRHPAAFADHAARFWLGPGGDPKKAVPLSALNLEKRKTPDAYALVLESRLAANEPAAATCKIAEAALAPGHPPARLRVLASRAFLACGQKQRAEAELQAAAPGAAPPPPPAPAPAK